jgi:hypothetical protein
MVAGWAFAASNPAALLAAQLLSGMCMSALEGDMDARVAKRTHSPAGSPPASPPPPPSAPSAAPPPSPWPPRVIADAGVGGLSVAFTTVLLTAMVLTLAWHRGRSGLPGTGPGRPPWLTLSTDSAWVLVFQ